MSNVYREAEPLADLIEEANGRGYDDGEDDARMIVADAVSPSDASDAIEDHRTYASPLSGEWAGRSVTEMLGDLLAGAERLGADASDILDAYEDGYWEGFDAVSRSTERSFAFGAARWNRKSSHKGRG